MKVIIAGSRTITDISVVEKAIEASGFDQSFGITEIISGTAKGVDRLGEKWAEERRLPVSYFRPKWDDLEAPGAVIKVNSYGKQYNARAGHDRNEEMAKHADALIAIWDGKSRGTKNMIENARKYGLKVYIYLSD